MRNNVKKLFLCFMSLMLITSVTFPSESVYAKTHNYVGDSSIYSSDEIIGQSDMNISSSLNDSSKTNSALMSLPNLVVLDWVATG